MYLRKQGPGPVTAADIEPPAGVEIHSPDLHLATLNGKGRLEIELPIEEMDLTVRSYNCLKREGIHSVGELVSRSEADLLDIRNFGAKSIDEVKVKLHSMGLALKDSPPGFDPSQVVNTWGAEPTVTPTEATFTDDRGDTGFA